eukprot:COSAG05_NODE_1059_length_6003_cov_3.124492_6_plen_50_part_00
MHILYRYRIACMLMLMLVQHSCILPVLRVATSRLDIDSRPAAHAGRSRP